MDSSKNPLRIGLKPCGGSQLENPVVNAVNLKEFLGFGSYGTAWGWMQKIERCNIRLDREKLSGRAEVDDFVISGQKSGKRGRGAGGKTIAVIAVER